MQTIGQRISQARQAQGLRQEDLALKLSVTPQAVSKWEHDLTCPDVTIIPDLAEILGLTCDELLKGENMRPSVRTNDTDTSQRVLHIVVTDKKGTHVKVNLPMSVFASFVKSEASFNISGLEDIPVDLNEILKSIEMGLVGTIVEASTHKGETVTISVD